MRRRRQGSVFAAFVPLCVLAGLAGCGSSGEEKAPYAAAVAALERHGIAVRQAFTGGAPEKAHDSLHELGNILDKFPTMVDGTQLSPADRDAVKTASEELFDAYTELDMSMHGGDAVKYEDLEEKIDTNLAILKEKTAAAGATGEHIVDPHAEHGEHAHASEDEHAHEDGDEHDHDDADHDHDGDGVQDHAAEEHDEAEGDADHEHAHGHADEAASESQN